MNAIRTFLIDLSQHLEDLGRGKDAVRASLNAPCGSPTNAIGMVGRCTHGSSSEHRELLDAPRSCVNVNSQLVEAAQKNPDSFQAQVRLATFYESTNQLKKASEAFEAALALRPKDSMTRQRYAQMLQRSGQAKEAVTQYSTLLKDNPNALGYNYWEVIDTFFQAGKIDELVAVAKEMIAPAIGRNFGNDFARNTCSKADASTITKPKPQLKSMKRYLKVQPDESGTYPSELASTYVAIGQREKAIHLLARKVNCRGYNAITRSS